MPVDFPHGPPGWSRPFWNFRNPHDFHTSFFTGRQTAETQLNNVRSHVESFVRAFILHLVPNAASTLQVCKKRIDDKHLDLEEKLYGAALMGLPCNKVDPLNFYLVD